MAMLDKQMSAAQVVTQLRDGMTIGINLFRDPKWERLDRMLIQPFVGPVHSYPINRREHQRGAENGG